MSVLPLPPPLRPSLFGSRQPSLSFSTSWTCSATCSTCSTKSGMPSPSESVRFGASIPSATQWTQKCGPQAGELRRLRARCRRCGWDRGRRSAAPRASVGRGCGAMNGFWLGEARLGTAVGQAARGRGGRGQRRPASRSAATERPTRWRRRSRIGGTLASASARSARRGRRYFAGDRPRRPMRVALAQIDPTVGDIDGNAAKIAEWIGRARDDGRRADDLPRALRPRLPGRGPLPEAPLPRRQPARGRGAGARGRAGHHRRWSASPSRSPAAATPATPTTRLAVLADGAVAGRLPQEPAAQLRRLRRAALLRPRRRAADDRGRRRAGRADDLRGRLGAGPAGAGRGRARARS